MLDATPITPAACKKFVTTFMAARGIPASAFKLRAKTVDFTDLARSTRVFVTMQIHIKYADQDQFGWVRALQQAATHESFHVSFEYEQDLGDERIFL